jgi:hypothetical protein
MVEGRGTKELTGCAGLKPGTNPFQSSSKSRSPETQLKGEEVYSSPGNRLRTVSRIFLASCTLFATAAISLGERPEISSSRARRTAAMMEAAMTSVGA